MSVDQIQYLIKTFLEDLWRETQTNVEFNNALRQASNAIQNEIERTS